MPLDFSRSTPWREGNRVFIFGWEGDNYVVCQTNIYTMRDVGRDPLELCRKDDLFSRAFSKMWDMGLLDEDGGVSFSTTRCSCLHISGGHYPLLIEKATPQEGIIFNN
jgi:hypothetical protein